MPSQPSSHMHFPSPLGALSFPLANEPHSGLEQSSPPKPGGHEHFPLYLLQEENCAHWKASRLQLKHGGQSGGRSSLREKLDWRRSALEQFWYACEGHIEPSIPSAASALHRVIMERGVRRGQIDECCLGASDDKTDGRHKIARSSNRENRSRCRYALATERSV